MHCQWTIRVPRFLMELSKLTRRSYLVLAISAIGTDTLRIRCQFHVSMKQMTQRNQSSSAPSGKAPNSSPTTRSMTCTWRRTKTSTTFSGIRFQLASMDKSSSKKASKKIGHQKYLRATMTWSSLTTMWLSWSWILSGQAASLIFRKIVWIGRKNLVVLRKGVWIQAFRVETKYHRCSIQAISSTCTRPVATSTSTPTGETIVMARMRIGACRPS